MPTLKWYKLIFKQLSPIHIGNFRWGVVNQTEIFIPGQVVWGALVKRYMELNKIKNQSKVEEIKKSFEKITNFFPSFDGKEILEPHYKDGEFHLGAFSEREFRFLFTFADFRTSIEPIFRKAKDEHLYEFEYISPLPIAENLKALKKHSTDKNNRKKLESVEKLLREKFTLYWIGLIGISEKGKYENFLKKGLKVWIGGDVRYGFGELILEEVLPLEGSKLEETLKDWNLTPEGKFREDKNNTLKNFLSVKYLNEIEKGELKLLVKLSFNKNIPQVEKDCTGIYAWVGSKIKPVNTCNLYLRCGKFG